MGRGIELYGWKWDKEVKQWVIVGHESKIVRYIYHLYLIEKLGYIKITEKLNNEGYRIRRNQPFSTPALNCLLNVGDIFSLKTILGHTSLEMVNHYLHFTSSQITDQHHKYSPIDKFYS